MNHAALADAGEPRPAQPQPITPQGNLDLVAEVTKSFEAAKLAAIHESAHAVVGELLGFRVMCIEEDSCVFDRRGSKAFRMRPDTARVCKRRADKAVAAAAGVAAMAICAGTDITDELRTGPGGADYELIESVAQTVSLWLGWDMSQQPVVPRRTSASLIAEWESQAMDLLRANWAWVEAVAELHSDWQYVSGAEVRGCRPEAALMWADVHVDHRITDEVAA